MTRRYTPMLGPTFPPEARMQWIWITSDDGEVKNEGINWHDATMAFCLEGALRAGLITEARVADAKGRKLR